MLGPIRRPVEVPEPFHLGSDVRSRSCPSSVVETCRMPLVFVRATTMIVMTRLFAHTISPHAFRTCRIVLTSTFAPTSAQAVPVVKKPSGGASINCQRY